MKRRLLSGNEAIALGALEAGVTLATGYPGTPSTEIIENLARRDTLCYWTPNEKIAVEMGTGASLAGGRVLVTMKHVGVNVAADPLFTLAYTGVGGGMVVVTADDPALHSSQNEQDNRRYASFARIPMLEPADSQEALEYTREAFRLSEEYDLPFFLRTTTRVSHGKSLVSAGEAPGPRVPTGLVRDPAKNVMVPANARLRHRSLEERLSRLAAWAEESTLNTVHRGESDELGVITSGVSYTHVREALPSASVLKLGMVFPLPRQLILDFASRCRRLLVVEELEPCLEEAVRALGLEVEGKSLITRFGEIDAGLVRRAVEGGEEPPPAAEEGVPARPPAMCVGCPHRGVFHLLSRRRFFVAGDIGCYTLAVAPPLSAIHTTLCMGAGVGQAAGIEAVLPSAHGSTVAVIGDSTFLHSGMGGVLNMAFNDIPATVLILDNNTTAMTGRQNHPGSGFDLRGNRTRGVRWRSLLEGLGVEHVREVDAYDLAALEEALKEETARPAPSVIVVQGSCMLLRDRPVKRGAPHRVLEDSCSDCGMCLRLGCPAISRRGADPQGKPVIDASQCSGCTLCRQVCRFQAIEEEG